MTEVEWLAATDPTPMLEFLRGKAGDRKLRLFASACSRSVGTNLWGEWSYVAIGVAERFADHEATIEELSTARAAVLDQLELYPAEPVYDPAFYACLEEVDEAVAPCSSYAANIATRPVDYGSGTQVARMRASECKIQSNMLKDIFGTPFRPTSIDPTWRTPAVTSLATGAYGDRVMPSGELDLARLAVLSDALEEAGCDNTEILDHLRSSGPHVRGCWVVDLLLGKV